MSTPAPGRCPDGVFRAVSDRRYDLRDEPDPDSIEGLRRRPRRPRSRRPEDWLFDGAPDLAEPVEEP